VAGVRRRERLFESRMDPATRDHLYRGWKQAVLQVQLGA
jgi:glycerol kinase